MSYLEKLQEVILSQSAESLEKFLAKDPKMLAVLKEENPYFEYITLLNVIQAVYSEDESVAEIQRVMGHAERDGIAKMEVLLRNGFNINVCPKGEQPILIAAIEEELPLMVNYLLEQQADPNAVYWAEDNDSPPLSPLHVSDLRSTPIYTFYTSSPEYGSESDASDEEKLKSPDTGLNDFSYDTPPATPRPHSPPVTLTRRDRRPALNTPFRPLFYAIAVGSLEMCQTLVRAGASLENIAISEQYTALSFAIMFGNTALVEFFLPGCDPNKRAVSLESALFGVVYSSDQKASERVQGLGMALGIENIKVMFDGDAQIAILKLLLADGRVDIRIKNQSGKTALEHLLALDSANKHQIEWTHLLLEAELNHKDPYRAKDLVLMAALARRPDVMSLLIQKGIVPDELYDELHQLPSNVASLDLLEPFVSELKLKRSIEHGEVRSLGYNKCVLPRSTPLISAVRANDLDMVSVLLTCKSLNLDRLAEIEHFEVDSLHSKLSASIVAAADPKGTALMLAAACGRLEMVQALVEKGATVDRRDQEGNTALMIAVRYQKTSIVEYLLQQGADPHIYNVKRKSAYQVASPKMKMVMNQCRKKVEHAHKSDKALLLQRSHQQTLTFVQGSERQWKLVNLEYDLDELSTFSESKSEPKEKVRKFC